MAELSSHTFFSRARNDMLHLGKNRISQRNAMIHEPVMTESLGDNPIMRLMDPRRHGVRLTICRTISILLLFFVLCVVTFVPRYYDNPERMLVAWGTLLGLYASLAFLLLINRFFRLFYYDPHPVGKPMVRWFSWLAFLDLVYQHLKPERKAPRFKKENMKPPHVESRVSTSNDGTTVSSAAERLRLGSVPPKETNEFYFDFLADTGDGFDPTYAVFSSIAKAEIYVHNDFLLDPRTIRLPRADCVFVGGDIAYPLPRHEVIMSRFVRPVSWAFPALGQLDPVSGHEEDLDETELGPAITFEKLNPNAPRMYIMPGNHEYFDGLVNFTKLILNRNHIGGWRTPNTSPYFAVRLPKKWWVFCLDPGHDHDSDLDKGQVEYFTSVVENETSPDDRFIVMQHEPDWIKNSAHHFRLFKNLQRFRDQVLGDRVKLVLAGDMHYYRRMEEVSSSLQTSEVIAENARIDDSQNPQALGHIRKTNKRQLIVAGFGGAFGHPTCNPMINHVNLGEPGVDPKKWVKFENVISYPSPKESLANLNRNVLGMFSLERNSVYGHIVGGVYLVLFAELNTMTLTADSVSPTIWPNSQQLLDTHSPWLFAVTSASFYLGFLWFLVEHIIVATANIPKERPYYLLVALSFAVIHTLMQIGFAFVARKIVDIGWGTLFGSEYASFSRTNFGITILYSFVTNISMYGVGYFVGVYVSALFFYIVFRFVGNGFGYNETYSLLSEKNYKGFVRIGIDSDGNLNLYAIGIDKTPTKWRETFKGERDRFNPGIFAPLDGLDMKLFLIEKLTIDRNSGAPTIGSASSVLTNSISFNLHESSP